jgi:Kef-type K+ transport system membrane component KefB
LTLSSPDLARMLVALALLLVSAHALGNLFARFRQPRVIGEIVGGLLLGPTALASLFPHQLAWVFPTRGPVAAILGAVYQLGLLLLMFCSGAEMRTLFRRRERKTVAGITLGGILVPFAAGILALSVVGTTSLRGPAAGNGAFTLVFGIAIAVTSIPVISKILIDLGIIGTSFARIVLGAAVVEDVVLYVALAVALGLASAPESAPFGLPALLHVSAGSTGNVVYHVIAEIAFIAMALAAGPRLFRRIESSRFNPTSDGGRAAFELVFVLALSALCVFVGVVPLFGALVAGLVAGSSTSESVIRARESIRRFAFAFFIPVYFAIVGFQLDLIRDFDPLFFVVFLVLATAIKAASVFVGARAAGETHRASLNFAVAMNARGGPGIVLASVAYGAGIVSSSFFASLVMLAVVTSLLAGSWLDRVVRSGQPLRDEPVDAAAAAAPADERTPAGGAGPIRPTP